VNSAKDLQFSAEFKLTASQILVIGGYDINGNGQTSAGIITNTGAAAGTWTALSSALPTGLGELEMVPLNTSTPPTRFLVAGGRAKRAGMGSDAVTKNYILDLVGTTANWTDLSTTHPMVTGVVIGKNNLQKCGASHWISIGGMTTGGMDSSTPGATDAIQKFNYDPTTPSNSNWETLKLGSSLGGTVKTVKLPQAQGYQQVLHRSDTEFHVAGGDDGTATGRAIANVAQLLVNSNAGNALDCTATDASVVSTAVATPVLNGITSLPAARARATSIQAGGTIGSGGTAFTYDFIIASGNDNSNQKQFEQTTLPTRIFFYNSTNKSYYNNAVAKNLNVARVFGRFVQDDTTSTSVKMATGTIGNDSNAILFTTTPSVDIINNVGVVAAGTAMTNSRVGSAVQLLTTGGNADFAALGTKYSGSITGVAQVDVEDF